MKAYLGFVCISFFFFFFFLVGLFSFLTNYEPNRCNMTFMYEYPQLIKIALPKDIGYNYNKYGLFAYGEGRSISKVREMKFSGIPVLFIPGNRGSPKQVRSLASVSLTKVFRTRSSFSFDYFAVDLNEDFSGLYGGFLKEQTTFVNMCIKKILSLYRRDTVYRAITPKSIIIIGHSMGGLIAKGLFLEPDFKQESVRMIITLATPHFPALLSDHMIASYYESVNTFWDMFNASENNINLISIGGGPRDLLVRSDLTLTPHAEISVLTTVIPSVWMSVDHLCILWCKELVLSLVRILFDLVDFGSQQLIDDVSMRREIVDYHLLNRSSGKSYHTAIHPEDVIQLFTDEKNSGFWIEMNDTQFTWTKPEGVNNDPTFVIISLATSSDTLALHSINHETRDWIFTCMSQTNYNGMKKCKKGTNLSGLARIAPTNDIKRKSAVINLTQLRRERYTHLVVRTLPTREYVQVHFDLFKRRDRYLPGATNYFFKSEVVPRTENKSLYYTVELQGVSKYWHTYEVRVTPNECPLTNFGFAFLRVPWSNEGSTVLLSGRSDTIAVSLVSPKPPKNNGNPVVELYLNPECTYSISVERSVMLALGAIVGRFGVVLISHITVCLLLTLAYQIKCLGECSSCPLLHFVMPSVAKPYFVVQATALTGTIAQSLTNIFLFLPETDVKNHAGFVEVVVIPLFLHLTAFALTYLFATGFLVSVAVQGQAFNGIFLKFINKFFFGLTWLSEYVLNGVSKVPIVVSAFMITVTSSACGGLALCIGLFFYFFKMISLYEDFWEEIVYWPLKVLKWKLKQRRAQTPTEMPKFELPPIRDISFHLTLTLLWAVSALISVPSVLVWAKNYKFSTHLDPDPSFYNAVIMSVCAGFLWQVEMPKTGLAWSRSIGYIIVGCSILIMVYAQTTIYRISYILSGVFVLVTVHQLIGGFFTTDDDPVVPELVPIQDEDQLTQEIEEETESSPLDEEGTATKNDSLDLSDSEINDLEEEKEKSANENVNEKDSPSEESSTSSFEHISENEQL